MTTNIQSRKLCPYRLVGWGGAGLVLAAFVWHLWNHEHVMTVPFLNTTSLILTVGLPFFLLLATYGKDFARFLWDGFLALFTSGEDPNPKYVAIARSGSRYVLGVGILGALLGVCVVLRYMSSDFSRVGHALVVTLLSVIYAVVVSELLFAYLENVFSAHNGPEGSTATTSPVTRGLLVTVAGLMTWGIVWGIVFLAFMPALVHTRDISSGERETIKAVRAHSGGDRVGSGTAEFTPDGILLHANTQWNNLLPLVDSQRDAVVGQWQLRNGQLHVAETPELCNRMEIPVIPFGSYEFRVRFTRAAGEGDLAVIVPVRWGAAAILLRNRAGEPTGLYDVQEQHRLGQEARRPTQLTNGESHKVHITVRLEGDQADIQMFLDEVPHLAWRGPQNALAQPPICAMPRNETLGIAAQATVVFHAAELRMLEGSARRYLPPRDDWTDPVATIRSRGGSVEPNDQGEVVRIDLRGPVRIVDRELSQLSRLPHLKSLELGENKLISDLGTVHLAQLENLQELSLAYTGVGDGTLRHIAQLANLRRLDLHCTRISDDGLEHLGPLKNLDYLSIGWTRVTDKGLVHLEQLQSLKRLHMVFLDIGDEGVEHLRDLNNLEELSFLGAPRLTDQGLGRLAALKKMRGLRLEDASITNNGLKQLASFPNLEDLALSHNKKIGDDGLVHLSDLKLNRLWIEDTQITSAGLRHLSRITALQLLGLMKTPIGDAALEHLVEMKHLRVLALQQTAVTAAGVVKLRAALPACDIAVDPLIEEQVRGLKNK